MHNVHFVKYVYLPTEQAETYGSDQMKKAQKKLTLSKIDFLSSVIIIGLD